MEFALGRRVIQKDVYADKIALIGTRIAAGKKRFAKNMRGGLRRVPRTVNRYAPSGSRFAVRGSRFAVRGSRFAVRGSRFAVRGSRFAPILIFFELSTLFVKLWRIKSDPIARPLSTRTECAQVAFDKAVDEVMVFRFNVAGRKTNTSLHL
jgi:hypothetical protein